MPERITVTISLVTHNAMRWLPGCLESVFGQRFPGWELRILDNASMDGTGRWLRDHAAGRPGLALIESSVNLGYAAGHNRNLAGGGGEYVVLLNQDVELDPDFLGAAVAALDARPQAAALQARVLQLAGPGQRTDLIDTTGLLMRRSRRVVSRRQGETQQQADLLAGPVWGADGPVPVYRRRALFDARLPGADVGWEILDEDFFMYKEDVDVAWRLRLLGWAAWYEPAALAWHGRTAGAGAARTLLDVARTNRTIPQWIKRISWRNQHLMQVKNELPSELARDLPWVAARELLSLGFILAADPRRLHAVPGLWQRLPAAARKRRALMRRAERLRRASEVSRSVTSRDQSRSSIPT